MAHHVKMADLSGPLLALAQTLVEDHSSEFGRVNIRETYEGSAHASTQTIYLRAPPWPMTSAREAQEDLRVVNWPLFQLDPRFQGLLAVLENVVGLPMARALIVNLPPGSKIKAHRDEGAYAAATERFHYPIKTNSEAISKISNEEIHMPAGTLWWFDKDHVHSAVNGGTSDRIHLIFDCWRP
jgi:hypothetical protein